MSGVLQFLFTGQAHSFTSQLALLVKSALSTSKRIWVKPAKEKVG